MGKVNTFTQYNITSQKRYTKEITTFKGVDASGSELSISTDNAVECLNMLYRDGILTKRYGFEKMYSVEGKLHSITDFNGKMIAHIGKKLYWIKNIHIRREEMFVSPITFTCIYNGTDPQIGDLNDEDSFMVVGGNRLYLFDGEGAYILKYESSTFTLFAMEDSSETYIPTIRTAVTPSNAQVVNATAYEDVNMMTKWRKERLISGIEIAETSQIKRPYFTLASPIVCESNSRDDLDDIEIVIDELVGVN